MESRKRKVSKIAVNFSISDGKVQKKIQEISSEIPMSSKILNSYRPYASLLPSIFSFSVHSMTASIYTFPFEVDISNSSDWTSSFVSNFKSTGKSELILRQANIFIELLGDTYNKTATNEISNIQPCIAGLLQCLKAGWRPSEMPMETVDVTIILLEGKDEESRSIARDFLMNILSLDVPSLSEQILIALVKKLNDEKHFSASMNYFTALSKAFDYFLNQSCASLILGCNSTHDPAKIIDGGEQLRSMQVKPVVKCIELGDTVQIFLDGVWIDGTIVQYNSMSGDILVEHVGTTTVTSFNANNIDFESNLKRASLVEPPAIKHIATTKKGNDFSIVIPSNKQDTRDEIFSAIFGDYFDDSVSSPLSSAAGKFPKCSRGHVCELVSQAKNSEASDDGDDEQERISPVCDSCKLSMNATSWNGSLLWRGWQCHFDNCNHSICLNCFPECDGGPVSMCFVGNSPGASALVYHSQSALLLKDVIGVVCDGSVIEVYDCMNSSVYRLANGMGYVGKHPVNKSSRLGGVWARVAADRYSSHSIPSTTEEDSPSIGDNLVSPLTKNELRLNLIAEVMRNILQIDNFRKIAQQQRQVLADENEIKVESPSIIDHQLETLQKALLLFELNCKSTDKVAGVTSIFPDSYVDDADEIEVDEGIDNKTLFQDHENLIVKSSSPKSAPLLPSQSLSIGLFEYLFMEINFTLTTMAEKIISSVISNGKKDFVQEIDMLLMDQPDRIYDSIMKIVEYLAHSDHKQLLIPYYYRVFIAKSGIRAKIFALSFLKSSLFKQIFSDVSPILDAFRAVSIIEKVYTSVVVPSRLNLGQRFKSDVERKFTDTVHIVGFTVLANGIIECSYASVGAEISSPSFPPKPVNFIGILAANVENGQRISGGNFGLMQRLLRTHILCPTDRFSSPSKNMRNMLRLLCKYADNSNTVMIERLWRGLIVDTVIDECSKFFVGAVGIKTAELGIRTDLLLDRLMKLLSDLRYVSRIDMAVTGQCCMSADFAFQAALKRVPKDISAEIMKALVVRVSSVIDSQKCTIYSARWGEAIEGITDLIRVLYGQSAVEFQHFYELLLARRLLRNRYISLSTERHVLALLPAMSKSELMIRDVERTVEVMHQFRDYIVHRIDFMDLFISPDITSLALSKDSLRINILTASMWPSFWILPGACSSLILPLGLDIIKSEFIQFFHFHYFLDKKSMDLWSISNEGQKCFQVHGSAENQARINGIFEPTTEVCDGRPVYAMRGNSNSILEFSGKTSSWQIKKRSDKGKNTGWAYCKASAMVSPDNLDKQWFVWKKSLKKWLPQPIKVTALLNHISYKATGAIEGNNNRSSTGAVRKLIWCHCAGTITLQAHLSGDISPFLLTTESQAAVLLLFNQSSSDLDQNDTNEYGRLSLTYDSLKKLLNLGDEDLGETLKSLITVDIPILSTTSIATEESRNRATVDRTSLFHPKDQFFLSSSFLLGHLGGLSIENPIVLSSIQTDKVQSEAHILAAGVSSLYGWRNELIDACIVRVLKDVFINKNGLFSNNSYMKNSALPIDALSYRVRKSLEDRCAVSDEDIMRRSERLVSIGVIDKVVGNIETLRSVAYCYLSETTVSTLNDPRGMVKMNAVTDKLSQNTKKLTGQDLFDHIRIILGISKLPFNVPGISKALFTDSFLRWMVQSRCNLDSPLGIHVLDVIADVAIEFLHASIHQLNTLKLQHWEGMKSTDSNYLRCSTSAQLVRSVKGLRQLTKNMKTLLNNHYNRSRSESVDACVHRYLGLDRVYLEHLPVEIIRDILNAFKALSGRPVTNYLGKPSSNSRNTSLFGSASFDDNDKGVGSISIEELRSDKGDILNNMSSTSKDDDDKESNNDQIRQVLLMEIEVLWNQTALVNKAELMWKFGFNEDWFREGSSQNLLNKKSIEMYLAGSLVTDTSGSDTAVNLSQSASYDWDSRYDIANAIVFPSCIEDLDNQFRSALNMSPTNNAKEIANEKVVSVNVPLKADSKVRSASTRWKHPTKQSPVKIPHDTSKVKLSFQHFISSLLLSASSNISLSNVKPEPATPKVLHSKASPKIEVSFDVILENIYFKQLTDELAKILRTELHYADESESRNGVELPTQGEILFPTESATEEERDSAEVMIPCEFCTDCFRVSQFEAHVLLCQSGRGPFISSPDATSSPRSRSSRFNKPAASSKVDSQKRPNAFSSIAVSFLQSLLNSVAKSAADEYCEFDFELAGDENDGDRTGFSYYEPTFSALVENTFNVLDSDRDGFLTGSDFSSIEISYSELEASVDPFQLYKSPIAAPSISRDVGQLNSFSFDFSTNQSKVVLEKWRTNRHSHQNTFYNANALGIPSSDEETKSDKELDSENGLQSLDTPIALQKSNSLWMSVSSEMSLPVVDASRSISGLDEVEVELCSLIDRARHILDDSEAATVALLVYYKWDLKALVEDYIDNKSAVRLIVGLGPRTSPPFYRLDLYLSSLNKLDKEDGHFTCGICADTIQALDGFACNCMHWFCTDCWVGYIDSCIQDRKVLFHCPEPNCDFLVTHDMQRFMCSEQKYNKAREVLIKSFVEARRDVHVIGTYCKNPKGCSGIVLMAEDALFSEACCSLCNTTFCSKCDLPPHAPATCEMVARWEELGGYLENGKEEDAEARKLKHLTTKPCPKCGVRIEKNGGCPHMTCSQPSCKYQFCWECSGEYHTSTSCSRPKVRVDSNVVLLFDDFDRQCANHFLARKVALKGKTETYNLLGKTDRPDEAALLRIVAEGWAVLADAQTALAHTCMFMLNVKSTKLSFLFENQKAIVQSLQQKFEETWVSLESFPVAEAKAAVRELQVRSRDFLLSVHTEIVTESKRNGTNSTVQSAARSTPASPVKPSSKRGISSGASELENSLFDLVRAGVFTLRELRDVNNTVFGDAFGTCWHSYSTSLNTSAINLRDVDGSDEVPHAVASSNPLNFFQNNFTALIDDEATGDDGETSEEMATKRAAEG